MNDFDRLLQKVLTEAKAVGVPVSDHIDSHITINKRAKQRFGRCNLVGKKYTIELSEMLLTAPEFSCCQTIAHELIHTCPGCMNHGTMFKKYAALMNRAYGYDIKRTNTLDEMGIAGQPEMDKKGMATLICRKCGRKIYRVPGHPAVLHPERYRCICGGGFTVVSKSNKELTAKYILQCKKCGKKIMRERMSKAVENPQLYRCTCGGELKRLK